MIKDFSVLLLNWFEGLWKCGLSPKTIYALEWLHSIKFSWLNGWVGKGVTACKAVVSIMLTQCIVPLGF